MLNDKQLRAVSRLFSAAVDAGEPSLAEDIGDWASDVCDGHRSFTWDAFNEYAAALGQYAAASFLSSEDAA
jgi:hypothetical protein